MGRQADVWFKDGDFPRVIQELKFIYALAPNDYDIATNLGWMFENIEEWDKALAVYIKYRKENPSDPDAPFPEAHFYFAKKAYAKVPPILEPSLKMHPHANTFRQLAHAYERLNMLADAKRVWLQYISQDPNDLAAKANLAKVERKMKGAK